MDHETRETLLNPAGRVARNTRKEGVLAASRNMSTKGTKVAKRKNYHTASVLALGQLGRRASTQRDSVGGNAGLKRWGSPPPALAGGPIPQTPASPTSLADPAGQRGLNVGSHVSALSGATDGRKRILTGVRARDLRGRAAFGGDQTSKVSRDLIHPPNWNLPYRSAIARHLLPAGSP